MVSEMSFTQLLLNKSENIIINTTSAETSLSVVQVILVAKLWQLKLVLISVQPLPSELVKFPTATNLTLLLLLSIKEMMKCLTLPLLLPLKHPAGTILTTLLCNTSKELSENIVVTNLLEST